MVWVTKDIEDAKNFVLNSKRAAFTALASGGQVFDTYKGVKVILLKTTGQGYTDDIGTVFPDMNQ
jgi:hypothetical protein